MAMKTIKLQVMHPDHPLEPDQPLEIEYFISLGRKETILYLHGLGCSKNDFLSATTTGDLQAYTLVAFDFPGCGNSPYPENITLGIDDLVEITNSIVSQLSLDDLVVIGHSMGGLVALLYIQGYGEHVKGFVNVEGNLAPEDGIFSREITKHHFAEFQETTFSDLKEELSRSDNRGFQKYVDTLEKYSSPRAFFDYCPSLVDYSVNGNVIQRFTELRIPKIFIYGSENYWLPSIPQLQNRGCEVVEIANSNHFPFYDNPQDYYEVIAHFLHRISIAR
jgi:pimeloyl-ACP methyl ester carboxylesterase